MVEQEPGGSEQGLALLGRSVQEPVCTSWNTGGRGGVWVRQGDQWDSPLGSVHSSPVVPRFVG